MFRRERRDGFSDEVVRLVEDAGRTGRPLAAKPEDGCPHHAHLALRDVDGMGAGTHLLLQRRLRAHTRNQAHRALGSPAPKLWAEIWSDIGPRIESVLKTGEATWDEGLLLYLERSGYLEETYHTFSYSPLADDTGAVSGMLCVVTEETERVIGERRLKTLRDLGARTTIAKTVDEACRLVVRTLGENTADVPFSLLYLVAQDGKTARLFEPSQFPRDTTASPESST